MRDFNVVSNCCHSSIDQGIKLEYPLGGSTYSIAHKIDVCSECGQPVDYMVEQCGVCGEVGCSGECEEHEDSTDISLYAAW
jgi:hypothetical protein